MFFGNVSDNPDNLNFHKIPQGTEIIKTWRLSH